MISLIAVLNNWALECGANNNVFLVTSVHSMFLLLFTSTGSLTWARECAIYAVQCYL